MVQKLKHIRGFKKVGHAGTLDPLAEGVLIILTDEDTKRQQEFMGLRKEYRVKVAFGIESDSHDLGTPVKEVNLQAATELTRDKLDSVLQKYVGKIQQQVPLYSAVHVKGQRLYSKARNQESPELPVKEIEIYALELITFNNQEKVDSYLCPVAEIRVECGKGTYIRSLIRDIGNDLHTGAVAVNLIRTSVGNYLSAQSENFLS